MRRARACAISTTCWRRAARRDLDCRATDGAGRGQGLPNPPDVLGLSGHIQHGSRDLTLIRDHDLQAAVRARPPLVSNVDPGNVGSWNSKIQPCSMDLSIGAVYLPLAGEDQAVSVALPPVLLKQGETAVVETQEFLQVPHDMAGIGFPPSSVSLQGLLMTNPGHIDPGYSGRLKFTVINMAKEPYELHTGQPICSVLFFRITPPDVPFNRLNTVGKPESSLRGLLRRLSRDFLSVTERITERVDSEIGKIDLRLKFAQVVVPGGTALLAAILTAIATVLITHFSGLTELRVKLEGFEKSVSAQELKGRLEKLEHISVQELKDRIEKLEKKVP